jgi:hypothetical protein
MDRRAAARADHHAADIAGSRERRADIDAHHLVARGQLARLQPRVRPCSAIATSPGVTPCAARRAGSSSTEIWRGCAADERLRDVGQRADLVLQVRRDLRAAHRSPYVRVQRERDDGHVVDGMRPHHRRQRARGCLVHRRPRASRAPSTR